MIKLKILVVTQYFWPEEFRINDICKGILEKGHEVEVLTGLPNYPGGSLYSGYSFFRRGSRNYEGIRVHRSYVIPRGKGNKVMLALNYFSFIFFTLFHIPNLLFKKFDKIFVFQTSPITAAIPAIVVKKLKKIPCSIYIQDLWPDTFYSIVPIKNKKIRTLLQKICTSIYNSFDLLFIASRGYNDILVKNNISADKIVYLPQWAENLYLDDKYYKKSSNNLETSSKDFIITFAGNIGKAQSVETIIKAAKLCKENKNIKWIILGDGSEFNSIKQMIEDYGLKDTVFMLGRKPVTEMPYYYSKSDALIVTLGDSYILKITLPAKVQSYMASGKPILGAISGEGMKVIKESNCGLVCESGDYEGLCKNVIKLFNMSEEERKKIGENGKRYFMDNYLRSKLLDKLEDYLLSLK